MKFIQEYFCCSPRLLEPLTEIKEIHACIEAVQWKPDYSLSVGGKEYNYQTAYNKSFETEFNKFKWKPQPLLYNDPKLIGDFQKSDIFIEIQFGNSATIYRDYYKFHYGLMHNLLSLAVYIVPTHPKTFFPNRPDSVANMAEFKLAAKYFKLLPIPVPILLIGLLPEN